MQPSVVGCPRWDDLTQEWAMLAPRARRKLCIDSGRMLGECSSPTNVLFRQRSWDAWAKLAVPVTDATSWDEARGALNLFWSESHQLSLLESLPAELIAAVLEQDSLERRDILALGMASVVLWPFVLQHIRSECRKAAAPLAGTEIACMNALMKALPKPFEKDSLLEKSLDDSHCGSERKYSSQFLIWRAHIFYADVDASDPRKMWSKIMEACDDWASRIPAAALTQMKNDMLTACLKVNRSACNKPWVLRNLTKRKYIRCRPILSPDGLLGLQGLVDHPEVKQLRIDDALLPLISWTVKGRLGTRSQMALHHGVWAGHRLDIVPLENSGILTTTAGEWMDVTDDSVRYAALVAHDTLKDIWASVSRKIPGSEPVMKMLLKKRPGYKGFDLLQGVLRERSSVKALSNRFSSLQDSAETALNGTAAGD